MLEKSAFYGVACARCQTPIEVRALDKSIEEFSVPCTKCGRRGMFTEQDLKPQRSKTHVEAVIR